nr:malto-oligosyltrehalose synthase [Nocardioidaceae bacterium]
TTGYDAASVVSRALAPRTRCELDGLWREVGGDESVSDTELSARRHVVAGLFSPELERLTRLAIQVAAADADADGTPDQDRVRAALDEVLAHVEVYRAYLRPGERADQDQLARLTRLTDAARAARPALTDEVDLLRRLLADVDTTSPAGRDLVVRFQQVCGPVMAKGVEDTTFYRFNRLLPLNEVGGDPGGLDEPGPERLHAWAAYQQHHHPRGLTTLSTHDTKRSEDVRARLLAVADDPATWRTLWDDVRHHAEAHDVDGPTGYLVFQTLLGSWPIDSARLSEYVEKAIREAKRQTGWQEPDHAYEQRVQAFVHDCLDDAGLAASLSTAIEEHAATIRARTLSAKLIQLTLPGVPDVYQGCEAVALTLVDPDNRRPVDFDSLEQRLARLDTSRLVGLATAETISPRSHESPATNGSLDDAKLLVTATALRLRRDHPELFGPDAAYAAVPSSDAVVAFERSHGGSRVVTAARFMAGVAAFALPVGSWRDVLTGAAYVQPAPSEPDPSRVDVDDVFARLPVALLVEEIR